MKEKKEENKILYEDVKDLFIPFDYKNKNLSMDDIILIDDNAQIKQRMEDFIVELSYQDLLVDYKLLPSRTMMFTGAPGMGKTFLAKILACKLQYPLYILDISQILKNGNGLDELGKIFKFVRSPENQPCILFMDECDGIAKSRENAKVDDNVKRCTNLIMQILQEENDSFDSRLVVIAASNFADGLDAAFMTRFMLQETFYLPNNYIPFIEMEVKKNKMFYLEKDVDDDIIKIINTNARQKSFSIREVNAKILWVEKQEVIERKKNNKLDGNPIPIKLSSILKEIGKQVDCDLDWVQLAQEKEESKPNFEQKMKELKEEELFE